MAHGEGRWYIDSCASAASGTFDCTLSVPPASPLSVGEVLTATARDAAGNTSEFAANATVTSGLVIQKRAFRLDGTPIVSGATMPVGIEFKFLLYINNRGTAASDISLQDVLDAEFAYQPGTLQVDNSVVSCAAQTCTPAEESTIFAAAVSAPVLTDVVDADVASFAAAVIDVGNQNAANGQLDIAGSRILAIVFSAKLQ